jgi:hypothetical protein
MAFFTPWFSFSKVLLFGHINNAPLHRIYAVVWDSLSGWSVCQRVDNEVVSFTFVSLQKMNFTAYSCESSLRNQRLEKVFLTWVFFLHVMSQRPEFSRRWLYVLLIWHETEHKCFLYHFNPTCMGSCTNGKQSYYTGCPFVFQIFTYLAINWRQNLRFLNLV